MADYTQWKNMTKNRVYLINNMTSIPLLDYLMQDELLTYDEYERIRSESSESNKIRCLIDHLARVSHPGAYQKFCEGLKKTNYNHIVHKLELTTQESLDSSYGSVYGESSEMDDKIRAWLELSETVVPEIKRIVYSKSKRVKTSIEDFLSDEGVVNFADNRSEQTEKNQVKKDRLQHQLSGMSFGDVETTSNKEQCVSSKQLLGELPPYSMINRLDNLSTSCSSEKHGLPTTADVDLNKTLSPVSQQRPDPSMCSSLYLNEGGRYALENLEESFILDDEDDNLPVQFSEDELVDSDCEYETMENTDFESLPHGDYVKQNNSIIKTILKEYKMTKHTSPDNYVRVVLFGSAGVGKSTMVASFNAKQYIHAPPTSGLSRDTIKVHLNNEDCESSFYMNVSIIDISGKTSNTPMLQAKENVGHVYIGCFSICEPETATDLIDKWYPKIKAQLKDKTFIVAGLKRDCFIADGDHIAGDSGKRIADMMKADKYIQCSSKNLEELNSLFTASLKDGLPHIYKNLKQKPDWNKKSSNCVHVERNLF